MQVQAGSPPLPAPPPRALFPAGPPRAPLRPPEPPPRSPAAPIPASPSPRPPPRVPPRPPEPPRGPPRSPSLPRTPLPTLPSLRSLPGTPLTTQTPPRAPLHAPPPQPLSPGLPPGRPVGAKLHGELGHFLAMGGATWTFFHDKCGSKRMLVTWSVGVTGLTAVGLWEWRLRPTSPHPHSRLGCECHPPCVWEAVVTVGGRSARRPVRALPRARDGSGAAEMPARRVGSRLTVIW